MRDQLLSGAAEIADRLIYRNSTSGFAPAWPASYGRGSPTRYAPCISLWRGTSGIALFLAELHATTAEPRYRVAAEQALHWCLANLETAPIRLRTSFLGGPLGVMYALSRVAEIFGERPLHNLARGMVRQTVPRGYRFDRFDLFGGASGALVVLTELARQGAGADVEPVLGDVVTQVAAAARVGTHGADWPVPGEMVRPGLAFGASGVAYGLLAALQRSQQPDLRQLIEGALQFDAEQLYPDASSETPSQHRIDHVTPCNEPSWCRGLTGLGISQNRAFSAGFSSVKPELAATLQSVRACLEERLSDVWSNFTLCHGCGGPLDLLMIAEDGRLKDGRNDLIARSTQQALVQMRELGIPLPGTSPPNEEDLSLFMGSAGVGFLLARAADHRIRSVLAPAGYDTHEGC